MALRFRKRVRIAPGVSINITRKGVTSATIGPRGANVNIGKKGSYLNAGLPGTGIYSRTRLSGAQPVATGTEPQAPATPSSPSRSETYFLIVGIIGITCVVVWWIYGFMTAMIAFWAAVVLWTAIFLVGVVVAASVRAAKRQL